MVRARALQNPWKRVTRANSGRRDAKGGLLDEEVEDGGRDLGSVAGKEAVEGLYEVGGKDEMLAGELILEVLRHGGGGHEESYGGGGIAECESRKMSRMWAVLPEPAGPVMRRIWLQCSAGRIKCERPAALRAGLWPFASTPQERTQSEPRASASRSTLAIRQYARKNEPNQSRERQRVGRHATRPVRQRPTASGPKPQPRLAARASSNAIPACPTCLVVCLRSEHLGGQPVRAVLP